MRHQNGHIEVKIWSMYLKLKGEFWNRDIDLRRGGRKIGLAVARIRSPRGIL